MADYIRTPNRPPSASAISRPDALRLLSAADLSGVPSDDPRQSRYLGPPQSSNWRKRDDVAQTPRNRKATPGLGMTGARNRTGRFDRKRQLLLPRPKCGELSRRRRWKTLRKHTL